MHGKPADNLAQLYFNYETETDASVVSYTKTNEEHEVRAYQIVTSDGNAVKLPQKYIFNQRLSSLSKVEFQYLIQKCLKF